MIRINSLVILCLARLAVTEDRISVDTVGTITATAGYSISDGTNHSPTMASLKSNVDFSVDTSKDSSSASSESYNPVAAVQGLRGGQSLALRSRQARGKAASLQQQQPWSQPHSGSVEDSGLATYPYAVPADHHRVTEQLYSVKPQTFDNSQSPSSPSSHQSGTDGKSDEGSVESSAPITYGKKTQNDGHDDRPVYVTATAATATAAAAVGDWSEEVRLKFDGGDKATRSRKKAGGQDKSRRVPGKRPTTAGSGSVADSKEGWQEVSPNMEMATGYSATVQNHDSSPETSDSAEHYLQSSMGLFQSVASGEGVISSIESAAPVEPQNFNHKQVLSKMNHFDFSNAVSLANKAPPPSREKRLNYQPGGPPVRLAYGGGQPLQAVPVSSSALPPAAAAAVKSVKIEQPNYHSIVVPMPMSHQMYATFGGGGGDAMSSAHSHQMTSSTMQQAMMSLPVVHNVFFKTDENGGGKTMPAIVIPLKPEYLQHLQQQQYMHLHQQQQHSSDASVDSQNAAGHQRPVHHASSGSKAYQYQQQQQQQQQTPPSLTPSPYMQQKAKPAKAKKPFGLAKDEQQQHRVKQPFGLQHQFYSNPFGGVSGGGIHHAGHQSAHGVSNQHQLQHGHHAQHETIDDTRYAQTVTASTQAAAQPFPVPAGHTVMVKRPHAYGYASPVAMPPAKFVQQVVNKAHQHQLQQQQQQQMSAEDLASIVQQQLQQPYKATTFHPGFAYLTSPDDDYPYRQIYKDIKKRNDMLAVQHNRRK